MPVTSVSPRGDRLASFGARGALPLLVCALLALTGCGHKTKATKVAGQSFPAVSAGSASVADITDAYDVPADEAAGVTGETLGTRATGDAEDVDPTDPFAEPVLEEGEEPTGDPGEFLEIQLTGWGEVMRIAISGGTFPSFEVDNGPVDEAVTGEAMYGLVALRRGSKQYGIELNPLTTIAAELAIRENLYRARSKRRLTADDVQGAVDAVNTYFSVVSGFSRVDVDIPFTPGAQLWGAGAHQGTVLTEDVIIGAVTAGLIARADEIDTISSYEYWTLVADDAADGIADGILHDFAITTAAATFIGDTTASYGVDPLGETLADSIEAFIGSAADNSAISLAALQPLLDKLRINRGVLLRDVPQVDAVSFPVVPGSRSLTVDGNAFEDGAQVFFDGFPSTQANVLSFGRLLVNLPSQFEEGDEVVVTVVNPSGKRHSKRVTVTLP